MMINPVTKRGKPSNKNHSAGKTFENELFTYFIVREFPAEETGQFFLDFSVSKWL